jgi:hypothetical protein
LLVNPLPLVYIDGRPGFVRSFGVRKSIMFSCLRLPLLCAASLLLLSISVLQAQDDDFVLPQDPAAWLNSPPITLDVIKGKAALLYYFEES